MLEGEITLVLDTAEAPLAAGDTVVQRGTNHAWSNRATRPALVALSSHDAIGKADGRGRWLTAGGARGAALNGACGSVCPA